MHSLCFLFMILNTEVHPQVGSQQPPGHNIGQHFYTKILPNLSYIDYFEGLLFSPYLVECTRTQQHFHEPGWFFEVVVLCLSQSAVPSSRLDWPWPPKDWRWRGPPYQAVNCSGARLPFTGSRSSPRRAGYQIPCVIHVSRASPVVCHKLRCTQSEACIPLSVLLLLFYKPSSCRPQTVPIAPDPKHPIKPTHTNTMCVHSHPAIATGMLLSTSISVSDTK